MIFFSDFDGTLTKEGRELTREFFDILDLIKTHNHELVIVSGRSLSWGHFFLTHFPLSPAFSGPSKIIRGLKVKRSKQ